MKNAGYVALSRQMVLQRQMDAIANNIANMQTPAYKAEELIFAEHLSRVGGGIGGRGTGGPGGGGLSFVRDPTSMRRLSPGPLTPTHNPLDLALPEEGYFVVETEAGERYTRAGNFTLDETGRVVTSTGQAVLGEGGAPLTVPPEAGSITVAQDGTLSTDQGEVGRFQIVDFENPQLLMKRQNNLYEARDEAPVPAEDPKVNQGVIEGSNVQGVVEMTRLIGIVRSYQAAQRMIQQEHDIQRKAIEALAYRAPADARAANGRSLAGPGPGSVPDQGHRHLRRRARQPLGRIRPGGRPQRHRRRSEQRAVHSGEPDRHAPAPRYQRPRR